MQGLHYRYKRSVDRVKSGMGIIIAPPRNFNHIPGLKLYMDFRPAFIGQPGFAAGWDFPERRSGNEGEHRQRFLLRKVELITSFLKGGNGRPAYDNLSISGSIAPEIEIQTSMEGLHIPQGDPDGAALAVCIFRLVSQSAPLQNQYGQPRQQGGCPRQTASSQGCGGFQGLPLDGTQGTQDRVLPPILCNAIASSPAARRNAAIGSGTAETSRKE